MIAEAATLDAGTVTVGAVASLLVLVAGGATMWANLRNSVKSVAKDVGRIVDRMDAVAAELVEHRHLDRSVHETFEGRIWRVEKQLDLELTPIPQTPHGTPKPPDRRSDRHRTLKPDEST